MGFPLSRFSQLLDEKCYGRTRLSRFKLYCIVLHDPENMAMKRAMANCFRHLDEMTGEDLLFMSFIDPPQEWKARHMDFAERSTANLCCERIVDEEKLLNNLRWRIGGDLPSSCIVVSNDLKSDDVRIIETNEYCVEEMIETLGVICKGHYGNRIEFDDLPLQMFGARSRRMDTPLLDSLIEVLAVNERKTNGIAFQSATEVIKEAVRAWKNRMAKALADEDDELYGELRRLLGDYKDYVKGGPLRRQRFEECRYSRSYHESFDDSIFKNAMHYQMAVPSASSYAKETASQAEPPKDYAFSRQNWKFPDYHRYEHDSLAVLQSYNKEVNNLKDSFGDDWDEFNFGISDDDYSGAVLNLYKFISIEFNHSLLQLVRKYFGVDIPAYYMVHQPDVWIKHIEVGKRKIYFNEYDKNSGDYKAPSLGDFYFGYREFLNNHVSNEAWEKFLIDNERFFDDWMKIFTIRNRIGHVGVINENEFVGMYDAFVSIMENDLSTLLDLKDALKVS